MTPAARLSLAALIAGLLFLCAAAPAHAGSSNFCPRSSGYIFLAAYSTPGDRCTQHYNTLVRVEGGNAYDYYTCLTAKPNADGSGGNVFAAVCLYSAWFSTGTYGATDTYGTIINHQGAGHNGFWARGFYSG
jgi:hypothetical protein